MAARGESTKARDALAALCEHYYEPILAYLRRAGYDHDGVARDLAHDFFADLLKGGRLTHMEREQGRFRSYLLGALKHYLSHHRTRERTQKRGGGVVSVSLNDTQVDEQHRTAFQDTGALPPDAWFDQQWAMAMLARALAKVEAEWHQEGLAEKFQQLRPWLTGDTERGDQANLANQLGIPANTLKSDIHRLRSRFRQAVKTEVGRTLANPQDVDQEMATLFAVLGGD